MLHLQSSKVLLMPCSTCPVLTEALNQCIYSSGSVAAFETFLAATGKVGKQIRRNSFEFQMSFKLNGFTR